jgi:hypothetical protein
LQPEGSPKCNAICNAILSASVLEPWTMDGTRGPAVSVRPPTKPSAKSCNALQIG